MSVFGLYYMFSYIFTLSYFMFDEKKDRIFESTLLIFLFSALVCIFALPIALSLALHKTNNSDEENKK